MSKQTLLISDLHLSVQRPETLTAFLTFLTDTVATTDELYILGDFFDAWIGDDFNAPPIPTIKDALKHYSQQVDVFFLSGNRDFLLGEDFCGQSNINKLDDVIVKSIQGQPTLLLHGDQLCTDDIAYQQAKLMLRDPSFIQDFLSKPIDTRLAIANEYRHKSGETTSMNASEIMDVNIETVRSYFESNHVKRMIHGHTHRPKHHHHVFNNETHERIVLPEWQDDKPAYLSITESNTELVYL